MILMFGSYDFDLSLDTFFSLCYYGSFGRLGFWFGQLSDGFLGNLLFGAVGFPCM